MKYSKHGEGVVVRKIQQDINYTVELLFNLIDYIKQTPVVSATVHLPYEVYHLGLNKISFQPFQDFEKLIFHLSFILNKSKLTACS
jgi:hypothetical protein